jgi:hypothetical protein
LPTALGPCGQAFGRSRNIGLGFEFDGFGVFRRHQGDRFGLRNHGLRNRFFYRLGVSVTLRDRVSGRSHLQFRHVSALPLPRLLALPAIWLRRTYQASGAKLWLMLMTGSRFAAVHSAASAVSAGARQAPARAIWASREGLQRASRMQRSKFAFVDLTKETPRQSIGGHRRQARTCRRGGGICVR